MNLKKNDQHIAEHLSAQLSETLDVEAVIVKGDLVELHVTKALYGRLAVDRGRSRTIMLALMQQMKSLTGLDDVTARVYCEKDKVIEAKTKQWGGDNVTYLYDL